MYPNLLPAGPDIKPDEETPDMPPSEAQRLRTDLELFSYIASHDLQAPLRIISIGCEQLHTHPSIAADEKACATLQMITGQAADMKALLDGLLEYMRLETFAVKHTLLDGNDIVATAISTLEAEIAQAAATVTCDPLPQTLGHRGRMTRLFAHLLDNAIKFRSAAPPVIHVSARRVGDMQEFCIEDNGIGIDKEYHTIIFTLFQRLHTKEAYTGIGAGLALARKIVEEHGGTLRVEPAEGQGSRFIFTIPAVP